MTHLTAVPAASLGLSPFSTLEDRHRAVMSLFPPELPGSERERRAGTGILFRVEATQSGTSVLVRSQIAPSRTVTGLRTRTESLGYDEGARVRWRTSYAGVYRNGRNEFRADPEHSANRVLDVLSPVMDEATVIGGSREIAKGSARSLAVDIFDGVGIVCDPDGLARLLSHGLGRSKAYGCGLLTVAVLP